MRAGTRPARGFTLIEIIVVVLVFSIMAAMAYGGLQSVLRAKSGIQDGFGRMAAFDRAFQRMRNDFQNVRFRTIRDTFGDTQAAFICTREGVVAFTRGGWRNPMMLPRSTFERVVYKFADKKLQRATYRVLDQAQDSKPVTATLLDDVEDVQWRFLDPNREWKTTWPPGQGGAGSAQSADTPPPRAVEVTLETKDWGKVRFLFRSGTAVTAAMIQSLRAAGAALKCPSGQKNCQAYQAGQPEQSGSSSEPDIGDDGSSGKDDHKGHDDDKPSEERPADDASGGDAQ